VVDDPHELHDLGAPACGDLRSRAVNAFQKSEARALPAALTSD
jgi:hypothetical protein